MFVLFISTGDLDNSSTVKPKHSPSPMEEIELRQRKPNVETSSIESMRWNRRKKDISELPLFVFILWYNTVEEETGVSDSKTTKKNLEEDNNVICKLSVIAWKVNEKIII